jgi:hypothetical protein
MENKFILLAISILITLISLLAYIIFSEKTEALAWVSICDSWFLACDTIPIDYPVVGEHIEWTQEMEDKRIADLKAQEEKKKAKPVKVSPKVEKAKESTKETKPEVKSPTKITLSDKIQVIACLNEKNMTIHQPIKWKCYLWQGGKWKNIMLPPKSHIAHFKKIFWDDYKYRLAIANYEWSFNEDAQNPYAIGYLQTLRTHKVKKDIVSQLTWLKNREDKNTWVACAKYEKENYTLFWTMNVKAWEIAKHTCKARRHYWAFSPWDGKHWTHSVMYAKRYKVTTEYYLSLDF